MQQPKVSVMILTYNQVDFVREAITSTLNQNYDNLEIIVADDGSTDGTVDIIKTLPNSPKLITLLGEKNIGITQNSNRALARCTGKYLAFLGGDDIMLPGKIAAQVAWLEQNETCALCYHDLDVFDSTTGKTLFLWSERHLMRTGDAVSIIRHGTYFGAASVMLRIPQHKSITFDERIPIASDGLYWVEVVAAQNGTVVPIPGVFARYRRHSGNITNQTEYRLGEALAIVSILEEKFPQHQFLYQQKRAEALFMAARTKWKQGQRFTALALIKKSLIACKGLWLGPLILIFKKMVGNRI